MTSILDIAPASAKQVTVPVRGVDVEVNGIGFDGIVYLIQRFPEVKDLFNGKDFVLDIDGLLTKAPTMVYGLIAVGTGDVEVADKAVAVIKGFTIEEQVALLDAVFKETFKGGIGPFVETVQRLLGVATDVGSKVSGMSGQKQSKP